MSKRKGTAAERDLVKLFWSRNYACIRSAGSGSMHFPSPDILAGNGYRRLAIEAKLTKETKKYFPRDEVKQLINFSQYFGAEPWLAIKFIGEDWKFVNPEDLDDTGNNYVFRKDSHKCLSFEELIGQL